MANRPNDPDPPAEPAATTAERPARALAAPVLRFDLAEEADKLRRETPWIQHGKNAVTLAKYPDLRVVFMLLEPGARLEGHQASGRISVHTLRGRVRLHLEGRTIDLPAGHLVTLEQEVRHDVEAVEESAFLLTIAWPGEPAGR